MIKYNHTHLPAKRHTGQIKPCSIDNNGKFTVRVFERYKKGKTYFLNTLEVDFLDTFKNFGKLQFKRLPQNRATSNILGIINDFSEQYAHVRSETKLDFSEQYAHARSEIKLDFSESIKKGLHGVEFKNKKLINLEFLQQYTHARSKTKVKDFINSTFETLNSINALTHNKYEGYYNGTTKHIAAKPSRHPLAIFMPIVRGYYPLATTGVIVRYINYNGSREPNKKPSGNKLRCLCAVVEARCHFFGNALLTKRIGGHNHA